MALLNLLDRSGPIAFFCVQFLGGRVGIIFPIGRPSDRSIGNPLGLSDRGGQTIGRRWVPSDRSIVRRFDPTPIWDLRSYALGAGSTFRRFDRPIVCPIRSPDPYDRTGPG
jgi:hypothetical protein